MIALMGKLPASKDAEDYRQLHVVQRRCRGPDGGTHEGGAPDTTRLDSLPESTVDRSFSSAGSSRMGDSAGWACKDRDSSCVCADHRRTSANEVYGVL